MLVKQSVNDIVVERLHAISDQITVQGKKRNLRPHMRVWFAVRGCFPFSSQLPQQLTLRGLWAEELTFRKTEEKKKQKGPRDTWADDQVELCAIWMPLIFCFCQMQRADIDVKWEGAPKPVLLRPYAGFDDEKGDTLMHLAVVGSTKTSSPLHLTYFSFLLQVSGRNLLLIRNVVPCR